MEIQLIKTLLSNDTYLNTKHRLRRSIFSDELAQIYTLLGKAHTKYETDIISVCAVNDMGTIYLAMGKIDSALVYTQKAYEMAIKSGINYWLTSTYLQFGSIHAAMKNSGLALNYWNLALEEANRIGSPKFASTAYNAIAQYYYASNQTDSAKLYATRAISSVKNTAFYCHFIALE